MDLTAEYRYLNISYDKSNELNSSEQYFTGGISWNITAKSKGLLKAGLEVKNFENSPGRYTYFSFEAQLDHRFTTKTSLTLRAYRETTETDVTGMDFSLTTGFEAKLQHVLTPKLSSSAGFTIANDHYINGQEHNSSLDSRLYQGTLGLQYSFRKWLTGGIGYAYTIKDSSLPELQYRSNTFYFNITGSI